MDWARLMRGRNSMAKAITPCDASEAMASFSACGASKAASTAPFFICEISLSSGPRTFRTMSASFRVVAASGATLAPAAI